MKEPITPRQLASELGVSPRDVRNWLRAARPRPDGEKWRRWLLTRQEAADVRTAFSSGSHGGTNFATDCAPLGNTNRSPLVPAGLTRKDLMDQLWREHEQRHDTFWAQYWRWGAFLIAVQVSPYLNDLAREAMGAAVVVFPIGSAVGAAFLAVLLAGEYVRLRAVDRRLSAIRGALPPLGRRGLGRLFALPMGWVAIAYLLAGILTISGVNFVVLLRAVQLGTLAGD